MRKPNVKSTAKLVPVRYVNRSEGPLYTARGEDGDLTVFDCTVTVLAADGKVYRHTSFHVPGAIEQIDAEGYKMGFKIPNRRYKEEVQHFIAKVEARGTIDLRYWAEVPAEPSPEEREAYNLRCEQEERRYNA